MLPHNPFGQIIGLHVKTTGVGLAEARLSVADHHLNPHGVVHGAVFFAMADTSMGAALYPTLAAGELCATIEVKINYFKPVLQGEVVCRTEMLNRGKTVANLESRLWVDGVLVAQANGNYAIFTPRAKPAG